MATYLADLQSALVEPTMLAANLFSSSFISREVRSRVSEVGSGLAKHDKAAILLEAVEKYIGGIKSNEKRSAAFLELLSILKRHVPIDNVARTMEKEYEEKRRVASDHGQTVVTTHTYGRTCAAV